MFDFNQDLNAVADSSTKGGDIRKGKYAFRIETISEAKTQAGAAKYEVACTVVKQADGQSDLVGITRKQHFVTGHAKPQVAKSYEAGFLALLKACGVDLAKLKNLGDLYMACKSVEAAKPVLVYEVAPQEKDKKYLDWTLVGTGDAGDSAASAKVPVEAQHEIASSVTQKQIDDDLFS